MALKGPIEMDRNKDSCVRASGIVPAHVDLICGIANREDTFILFRPVNPNSTSLIAEGFGTKGLDIHSKSSDWGPQAGFICENQLLSKADTQPGIDKGNEDAHHSLHEEGTRVDRFPLIVTKGRVNELTEVAKGKKSLFRTAGTWPGTIATKVSVTPTKALGSKEGVVELGLVDYGDRGVFMQGLPKALRDECERSFSSMISKLSALSSGYLVVYRLPGQNFSPVFTLGYKSSGLPVTADYDIFAICPNLRLSRAAFLWKKVTAKVLGKSESTANWAGLSAAAKQSLGHKERNHVDGQMGRITTFQQKIKTLINTACNGVTNPVVHHGTEMDNTQFPEQDQRIVVITPAGGIGVTRDWSEVQNVGQDILKLGYVFYRNRCYVASEQQQNMSKGKKFYFGQGEKNPSELFGNGKSFVWNPEVAQDLKVLLPTDAKV